MKVGGDDEWWWSVVDLRREGRAQRERKERIRENVRECEGIERVEIVKMRFGLKNRKFMILKSRVVFLILRGFDLMEYFSIIKASLKIAVS